MGWPFSARWMGRCEPASRRHIGSPLLRAKRTAWCLSTTPGPPPEGAAPDGRLRGAPDAADRDSRGPVVCRAIARTFCALHRSQSRRILSGLGHRWGPRFPLLGGCPVGPANTTTPVREAEQVQKRAFAAAWPLSETRTRTDAAAAPDAGSDRPPDVTAVAASVRPSREQATLQE